MTNSGDTGLVAIIIVGAISLYALVQGLFVGQRTKDAQTRTNERLRAMEANHNELLKLSGEIKVMSLQVHTMFENQQEKEK